MPYIFLNNSLSSQENVKSSAYLVYTIFLLLQYPAILKSSFLQTKLARYGDVTAPCGNSSLTTHIFVNKFDISALYPTFLKI